MPDLNHHDLGHKATIYTGCFFKDYPGAIKVSIARSEPRIFNGPKLKLLAPSYDLLRCYKAGNVDIPVYSKRYREEILSSVNKDEVMEFINKVSRWEDCDKIILCCWEKTGFCHRQLVAEWLGITEAI